MARSHYLNQCLLIIREPQKLRPMYNDNSNQMMLQKITDKIWQDFATFQDKTSTIVSNHHQRISRVHYVWKNILGFSSIFCRCLGCESSGFRDDGQGSVVHWQATENSCRWPGSSSAPHHVHGLVQDCGISGVLAVEIPQSLTEPLIYTCLLLTLFLYTNLTL